jgi:molybdenum cofactor biosynthesis protein B
MGTREHKQSAPRSVAVGILTVSTTRSLENDESGHWIARQVEDLGHRIVCHRVVTDDAAVIAEAVRRSVAMDRPDVLIVDGGTGIAPADVTIEAVRPLFHKELTAFAALFAQVSFVRIGSAAIMSRAAAGVIEQTAVFCLPGSLNACRTACQELVFPEMGHLVHHLKPQDSG